MKKKKWNRIRVKALKVITFIASVLYVLACACMGSEDITIPTVVAAVCGGWMVLICIANTDDGKRGGRW